MYKARGPAPIVKLFANVVAFWFQVEFGGNIGWLYDWPLEKKSLFSLKTFEKDKINLKLASEEIKSCNN